jgi:hypothetical protein
MSTDGVFKWFKNDTRLQTIQKQNSKFSGVQIVSGQIKTELSKLSILQVWLFVTNPIAEYSHHPNTGLILYLNGLIQVFPSIRIQDHSKTGLIGAVLEWSFKLNHCTYTQRKYFFFIKQCRLAENFGSVFERSPSCLAIRKSDKIVLFFKDPPKVDSFRQKKNICFILLCIKHSSLAGNLIYGPVFEWLNQDDRPFKNRTQIMINKGLGGRPYKRVCVEGGPSKNLLQKLMCSSLPELRLTLDDSAW